MWYYVGVLEDDGYKVYRGYIVFAFSVIMYVCKLLFLSKISQQLLELGF